ncbi:MAG TPA: hypothetical protein VD996_11705 [Chitinophagaceae bacterium]|nr:hypothetical protein [Chitinophagaceae bacterium]
MRENTRGYAKQGEDNYPALHELRNKQDNKDAGSIQQDDANNNAGNTNNSSMEGMLFLDIIPRFAL